MPKKLSEALRGKAHCFGDNVNTDYIIPSRYKFQTLDEEELAQHLMEDLRPGFSKLVRRGDFIVAGKNFGCGSSREQAVIAIKAAGIAAIIAKSFARIFYRNAINLGLPALICEEVERIEDGDQLEVLVKEGLIVNETKGITLKTQAVPDFMLRILEEGGLINYLKKYKGFRVH